MNTFNSLCIGACVFMIFLSFSFAFIEAIGAFPTNLTSPIDTDDKTLDIMKNLSSNITGTPGTLSWNDAWLMVTTAVAIGVGILSILTGTTNLIGVYLFGTFFWASWAKLIIILNTFDFLETGAGAILVLMITVGMGVMFYGAIVGMLSGSVSLR